MNTDGFTMPKPGQRVRVVLEGAVSSLAGRHFIVGEVGDSRNYVAAAAEHVVSVEIIADPIKAGDIITADQFEAHDWKKGSLVQDLDPDGAWTYFRVYGKWVSDRGGDWAKEDLANDARKYGDGIKVLYLP